MKNSLKGFLCDTLEGILEHQNLFETANTPPRKCWPFKRRACVHSMHIQYTAAPTRAQFAGKRLNALIFASLFYLVWLSLPFSTLAQSCQANGPTLYKTRLELCVHITRGLFSLAEQTEYCGHSIQESSQSTAQTTGRVKLERTFFLVCQNAGNFQVCCLQNLPFPIISLLSNLNCYLVVTGLCFTFFPEHASWLAAASPAQLLYFYSFINFKIFLQFLMFFSGYRLIYQLLSAQKSLAVGSVFPLQIVFQLKIF